MESDADDTINVISVVDRRSHNGKQGTNFTLDKRLPVSIVPSDFKRLLFVKINKTSQFVRYRNKLIRTSELEAYKEDYSRKQRERHAARRMQEELRGKENDVTNIIVEMGESKVETSSKRHQAQATFTQLTAKNGMKKRRHDGNSLVPQESFNEMRRILAIRAKEHKKNRTAASLQYGDCSPLRYKEWPSSSYRCPMIPVMDQNKIGQNDCEAVPPVPTPSSSHIGNLQDNDDGPMSPYISPISPFVSLAPLMNVTPILIEDENDFHQTTATSSLIDDQPSLQNLFDVQLCPSPFSSEINAVGDNDSPFEDFHSALEVFPIENNIVFDEEDDMPLVSVPTVSANKNELYNETISCEFERSVIIVDPSEVPHAVEIVCVHEEETMINGYKAEREDESRRFPTLKRRLSSDIPSMEDFARGIQESKHRCVYRGNVDFPIEVLEEADDQLRQDIETEKEAVSSSHSESRSQNVYHDFLKSVKRGTTDKLYKKKNEDSQTEKLSKRDDGIDKD